MATSPSDRPSKENRRRARAALRPEWARPGAYAIVFLDDEGAPESVVATFPGPMSAEMYARIAGGPFRVVRMDSARRPS